MSCFVLLFGEEERDGSTARPPPPTPSAFCPPQGGAGEGEDWERNVLTCIPALGIPSHPFSALTAVTKEISAFQLGILGHALPLKHLNK